jgi:DNA-binding transcriptional MerR regulator
MAEPHNRLPSEVAAQLQVSPSTLRRWSNEFADFMSGSAGHTSVPGGQTSHRRYTDADLQTLLTVKGLLNEGMTYIQVCKRLEALRVRTTGAEPSATASEAAPMSLLAPPIRDGSPLGPAVTVLADTLHTVAAGQQLLLGSQQANRDLLSVVVQDNFNLKEENAKLRDRMLELERDLAELRRLDGIRRETLEARLQQMEEQLRQRGPVPKPSERPGCLASLFGPLG